MLQQLCSSWPDLLNGEIWSGARERLCAPASIICTAPQWLQECCHTSPVVFQLVMSTDISVHGTPPVPAADTFLPGCGNGSPCHTCL